MECLNYLSITKPATLIFLGIVLLSSTNLPSILSQEYEQYIRCRPQFNCGKITRIDYPFWGGDRPEECGYPGLKLDCTNGTTIIQINSVDYRVLDINQFTQVLKTTRNDLSLNLCTQEFKNATLDTGLFEYVSGYINVTFLYGCPNLNFPVPYQFDCPVKGIRERNGYVEFGVQLSGMCHKSVVVPVSSQSFVNFLDLKEVVRQGFDVRYKVEISGCQECKNSGGSCGYDVAGKQLSCLCGSRNQSAGGVLKTCTSYSMLPAGGNNSQASTVTAPETAPNGSSEPDEFYKSCGNTYSCGNAITGIGYPFRDVDDPPYCGHPSFVLTCDSNNNVTNINIQNTKYRVLEIHQDTQLMTIVREDIMVETCPQEMVNTTLDNSLFDYASTYTNFTFLYGCPALNFSGLSPVSCWNDGYGGGYNDIYVSRGNEGPGMCNASVTVPAAVNGNGAETYGNLTGLDQVLRQGFEIRWKLDSKACSDCTESKGNCGFNFANNQTACICPDPPYIADSCSMINGASPAIKPASPGNSSNTKGLSIGLPIAGAVLAGVGLGWLIFYCKQRTKKRIAAKSVENGSKEITTPPPSIKGLSTPRSMNFTRSIPSYPSSKSDLGRGSSYFGVHVFDYTELEEATNNFDPSKELGDGGFGTVYYGVLADGRVVAVKRLYENNVKRVEQFMNEVEILTRLRHKNLVMLYGCTSKRSRELLLVYEYIPNGTVADHLHGKRAKSGLLSWPVRLNIAIETADALAYLHKSDIIHRDVKTNNVLLDNDFHVKVADFGLSRLFPTDVTHVSTAPQGTPGYVDPEYYQCYQLTEKSDVYSFGVMLIELISSLQAVDTSRHRHDINLANMAINKIQNRALHELVDSSLGFEKNNTVRRMVTLVAELAFRCLQQERDMRPSMEDVLEALKGIQNEDLNSHKVEIVDILVDEDARLPKSSIDTLSPDSVVPNNWGSNSTPNSSG